MARTLFTSVRILDCTGAEPYPGEVLVEGARIAAIARDTHRLSRDNVDVIDGGGATLMPGLIESHAHLSIDNAADLVQIGMIPPEETTLIAVRNAKLYGASGFRVGTPHILWSRSRHAGASFLG